MTAAAPTIEKLFAAFGSEGGAQKLELIHPEQPGVAWLAFSGSRELASHAPDSFLSASESARVAVFRFDQPRENFLVGRLAAKSALGAYMAEEDWRRIELTRGVFGQPVVNHAGGRSAEVSLSHSNGLAVALAFPSEHAMAVDLEIVDDSRTATVRNELKLLPFERTWVASGTVDEKVALVLLWTVREALGKALRCGLACPLELLGLTEIQAAGDGVWEGRYQNFSQFKSLSWVRGGFVLSVAMPKTTELRAG